MAARFIEVISGFGLEAKLGCFVMDNSPNNDNMMRSLRKSIPTIQAGDRLRCAGHILNLI